MKSLFKLTFIILILLSCKNEVGVESGSSKFPYSLSEILKYNMVGESVEYSAVFPDSSHMLSELFCDTFNQNPELYLDKGFTIVDSTIHHFFHASPISEQPWFCYSGTFYIHVDHPDMLYRYSQDFVFPIDSLSDLIVQTAGEEDLTVSELLKFRQYENSNFWTPKLFFFIEFNECDSSTLTGINKVILRIEKTLNTLKSKHLGSEIKLAPRIIIKKHLPT